MPVLRASGTSRALGSRSPPCAGHGIEVPSTHHHVQRWLAHVNSNKAFKMVVGVIRGYQMRAEKAAIKVRPHRRE